MVTPESACSLVGLHVEALGEQLDAPLGVLLGVGDLRAFAAQAEEQLGAQHAGAGTHHARGLHDQVEHVRADPVARVGDEARAALRVELAHGHHQAEAALGDQLPGRDAVTPVLHRHGHHEAQVGLHQGVSRGGLAAARAQGQHVLLLAGEAGSRANPPHVLGQAGIREGARHDVT
jgi:hypothetical protein